MVRYRRVADYFEEAAGGLKNPSLVARWLLGPVYSRMSGDAARENFAPAVSAAQLHELAGLVEGRGLSTHCLLYTSIAGAPSACAAWTER